MIPYNNATKPAGFLGGAQIGYNWQAGMAVFGWEADFSGLSGSTRSATTVLIGPIIEESSGKIEWLGTVRGRLGAAITNNTLAYITGGYAFGRVNNTHIETDGGVSGTWQDRGIRHGYAVGGGLEHMIVNNWSLRLEGMYVDLGKTTMTAPTIPPCATTCQPLTFSNKATMVRAGINYKFGGP